MKRGLGLLLLCTSALAQAQAPADAEATPAEKHELAEAIKEANTSGYDITRVLEAHLRKYPNTPLRPDIYNLLAKAAVEIGDDARIIRYGEPALTASPNDVTLLDRVSRALLNAGGKENAARALGYAKRFEDYVIRVPVPAGYDAVKNQEDHDRALARALLYESRAHRVLGDYDEARRTAALAYIAYPDEPSARAWSEALELQGKHQEAIERLADAFAIADPQSPDDNRAADRKHLGEMYRKLHDGSEKGLGDEVLAAYDRTSATMAKRVSELRKLDPNLGVTDPMNFTLTGLDGGKLDLKSLRGKVVIFDFWATWCVPCRAQHPLYEELKQRFRARNDVVFLSVDTDEDHQLVAPFLESQHWSGSSVFFDNGLVRLLTVSSIPTTIIADKQGRLASRMNGFNGDKFVGDIAARIQAILDAPGVEK
ncbi:MAG TPA: TlpA disulfide reductase family protein [Candidatus Sulfopaludibacter sp.]|nr:TlpA disulfide reductase family protein [Candidatus Sulfopaludibacter sp.]